MGKSSLIVRVKPSFEDSLQGTRVFIIAGLLINGASLILLGLNELIPIPLVTCTDLFQRSLVCIIHTRHISVAAGQY